jgi:hypothetical protein
MKNNIRRISPNDGCHYFFGYYDIPAFDRIGRLHLCHRVGFRDRLPVPGDAAELGFFDLSTGGFEIFGETHAWNFQQGAMLQWLGQDGDLITYNDFNHSDGFHAVVYSLGKDRIISKVRRPFATLSADGAFALSINFSRMYDFRPGYGYCNLPDEWRDEKQPADDGIYLVDLKNNSVRLILSLANIAKKLEGIVPVSGEKLLVNHITFNTGGTRFLALVRNLPVVSPGGKDGAWGTTVITANRDGTDLRVLPTKTYASHYHWKNDEIFAIHSDGPSGHQLYEITDTANASISAVDSAFFLKDGHCSYSPDKTAMLYDSYPDEKRLQHLYIYDLQARRGREIGAFHSPTVNPIDIRCDLHPRWSPDGKRISFDSTHEEFRGLYLLTP